MDADHSLAPVVLDGESLTIEKVVSVARYNAPVALSEGCYEGIDRARALVEKILREDRRVYGISTGFGEFSKVNVGHEQSAQLQENLILSHCVATGTPFGREIADLMLAVNRSYGRSDYLPCICWGLTAREAALREVGAKLALRGRIQSRRYLKQTENGTEERTAFEVSAAEIEWL